MLHLKSTNLKEYDYLKRELDKILKEKRISYSKFSVEIGINTASFYYKYKVYNFSIDDMVYFVECAKKLSCVKVQCFKCLKEFIPKSKCINKKMLCPSCKSMSNNGKKSKASKTFYPSWVKDIQDDGIRDLVKQEYHIDEETAAKMAKANDISEAKSIRENKWK